MELIFSKPGGPFKTTIILRDGKVAGWIRPYNGKFLLNLKTGHQFASKSPLFKNRKEPVMTNYLACSSINEAKAIATETLTEK